MFSAPTTVTRLYCSGVEMNDGWCYQETDDTNWMHLELFDNYDKILIWLFGVHCLPLEPFSQKWTFLLWFAPLVCVPRCTSYKSMSGPFINNFPSIWLVRDDKTSQHDLENVFCCSSYLGQSNILVDPGNAVFYWDIHVHGDFYLITKLFSFFLNLYCNCTVCTWIL